MCILRALKIPWQFKIATSRLNRLRYTLSLKLFQIQTCHRCTISCQIHTCQRHHHLSDTHLLKTPSSLRYTLVKDTIVYQIHTCHRRNISSHIHTSHRHHLLSHTHHILYPYCQLLDSFSKECVPSLYILTRYSTRYSFSHLCILVFDFLQLYRAITILISAECNTCLLSDK